MAEIVVEGRPHRPTRIELQDGFVAELPFQTDESYALTRQVGTEAVRIEDDLTRWLVLIKGWGVDWDRRGTMMRISGTLLHRCV